MTLKLEISFDCAAKEIAFLKSGWGIREVRGPYLIDNQGIISVPSWLFHKKFATTVSLLFSLSNRSKYDGVEVSLCYLDKCCVQTVMKNGTTEFILKNIFQIEKDSMLFITKATSLDIDSSSFSIRPVVDLLTLDRIAFERNINPTVRY